jgi:hypothetical protein
MTAEVRWFTKMPEFAPVQAHRPPGPCPAAEDLAAYIDGTLGETERAQVTAHLASCEDCYAVYTETLHFQLESDPDGVDEEVPRFPAPATSKRRFPVEWLSLAALLLIGVGSGSWFQFLAPPPHLVTTPPPPSMASLPGDPLWLGPTYRGEGGGGEVKVDEAAFRFGVQAVNLQTTLRSGRSRESQDVIARILNLLEPQPFTQDLYGRYAGITAALEKRPPAEALPEASRLAQESREVFDTTSLDLGQWVEAGRLAAMARNPTFFRQADTRRFLRRLRWNDRLGLHEVKLDPVTRESLDRISEILSKSDLQPADYPGLRRQLERILEHYYPQS